MNLNLTTKTTEQELIKTYLEHNASASLADKINNGVIIVKDGKRLVSKKDLDGFMKYASNEAKTLSEKGATCACIEDSVVYGWAIHYFEEDSINGTLYNEDGTEYKPASPKPKLTPKPTVQPKPKPTAFTLFDLLNENKSQPSTSTEEDEIFAELEEERYLAKLKEEQQQADKKTDGIITTIYTMFGNKISVV